MKKNNMPKEITKLSRFKEFHGQVVQGLSQAGKALEIIRDERLYLEGGMTSFKDYCESIGKDYHWGWRQIDAGKIATELPSVKNEAAAREVKKIALPQRRQIVETATEQAGGQVTAKAIQNAAKSLPARKNQPKDATGLPIPPEIEQFWNRNEEVQFLLGMVSKIKGTLTAAHESRDCLWSMVDINGCVAHLEMLHQEISAAKSYAVCPTCNGVDCATCEHCRGRGSLSKFHWGLVAKEVRELRES